MNYDEHELEACYFASSYETREIELDFDSTSTDGVEDESDDWD